jgi:hypothetical protein
MRRGFKTEAERLADRTRAELGLQPHAHMPIRSLAAHLDIEIFPADQLVNRVDLEELDQLQPGAFSAAAFHLPGGRTVIVSNPLSEVGRTNSDIAHEIAHVLLDHEIREIQQLAGHLQPRTGRRSELARRLPPLAKAASVARGVR